MEIRKLNLDELADVYQCSMLEAFPPDELKPYYMLKAMTEQGFYASYGCFKGGEIRAYALFVWGENSRCAMLDYFAVIKEYRGTGIGGEFLSSVLEMDLFDTVILEIEDVDRADSDAERNVRERRRAFYRRLGIFDTDVRSCAFGVDYAIMVNCKGEPNEPECAEALTAIYRRMLPEEMFKAEFKITAVSPREQKEG